MILLWGVAGIIYLIFGRVAYNYAKENGKDVVIFVSLVLLAVTCALPFVFFYGAVAIFYVMR